MDLSKKVKIISFLCKILCLIIKQLRFFFYLFVKRIKICYTFTNVINNELQNGN